jgi:hypothetical protein
MDFSQYSQAEQAQIAAMMEHKQVLTIEQLPFFFYKLERDEFVVDFIKIDIMAPCDI